MVGENFEISMSQKQNIDEKIFFVYEQKNIMNTRFSRFTMIQKNTMIISGLAGLPEN